MLAQRFRFTLDPGQWVALRPLVTLARKYGPPMRLDRRTTAATTSSTSS